MEIQLPYNPSISNIDANRRFQICLTIIVDSLQIYIAKMNNVDVIKSVIKSNLTEDAAIENHLCFIA